MHRHWIISGTAGTAGIMPAAALAAAVCMLMSAAALASDAGDRVIVLLSSRFSPYEAAVKGFRESLAVHKKSPEIIQENFASRSSVSIAKSIKASRPAIIVTIGTKATLATLAMGMDIPLVFSMVLDPPEELVDHAGVTGVLLDIPAARQLIWIKKICPDAVRIGIIHTRATARWVKRCRDSAGGLGLEIVPLMMGDASTLPDMLDRLEQSADVLLAVPDGEIYNTVISPQIILFCLQHRIPFVGLSGNFVRAGALFALDCDYRSIGEQTADIVRDILAGKSPADIPLGYPGKIIPSFNMRTARILGIRIPHNVLENANIFAD